MRREQQNQQEQKFHGVKLEKYRSGTSIVVNIDGTWTKVTLGQNATIEGDELVLNISQNNTPEIRRVKEPPRIVAFANNDTFEDTVHGTYSVGESTVLRDGSIEYELKDANDSVVGDVPQEFLEIWRDNLKLEKRIQDLQRELASKTTTQQTALLEKVTTAQKLLQEVYIHLPDVDEMSQANKKTVDALSKKMMDIQKRADAAVKMLQQEISILAPESQTSSDYHHKKTKAENIRDKRDHEAKQKEAKDLFDLLQLEIDKEKEKINDEESGALEAYKDQKQEEYDQLKADWQTWNNQGKRAVAGGLQQEPAQKVNKNFNKENIKLPPVEKRKYDTRRREVERDIYARYMDSRAPSEIKDAAVAERKKMAQNDALANAGQLVKDGSDYRKPTTKKPNPRYLDQTYEALKKVLEKRTKDYVDTDDTVPDGKELFDFDATWETLKAGYEQLLQDIPKKEGSNVPLDEYASLYTTLQTSLVTNEKSYRDYQSQESYQKEFSNSITENELRDTRVLIVKNNHDQLKQFELEKKQIDEQLKLKEHTQSSEGEKTEIEKNEVVDIPEYVMRELLSQRSGEMSVAIRALLEGAYDTNEQGVVNPKNSALDAFKNIFDRNPLNSSQEVTQMLTTLRDCGIKSWAEFKKLWDDKLALATMGSMNELTTAIVHRNIAENITWYDKLLKNKGQIVTRATLSAVLVGGGAAAATVLTGGGTLIAAALGGAAGGTMRGLANKWIFGSKWMKGRQERLQKELEDSKRNDVIDGMVAQIMNSITHNDPTNVAIARSSVSNVSLEGLPSFAGIVAQTVRDITTEMVKLGDDEPDEAKALTGNARILYERALENLETRTPDAETKKELAQTILAMNNNGDKKFEEIKAETDPRIIGLLERTVATPAGFGKRGIVGSAFMGGLIGGAFFINHDLTRAGMGAVFGGIKGYESGKAADLKAEKQKARIRVYGDINYLRGVTEGILKGTQNFQSFTSERKQDLRNRLVNLKRLLHTNVTDTADLAIFGIVGKNKEGHLVDHVGNVVVSKEGEIKSVEVRALMQDMRATVRDAERAGILFEEEADRARMDKVLETMRARTTSITEKHEKRWTTKTKEYFLKRGRRIGYTVAGAATGALTSFLLGKVTTEMRDYVREDIMGKSDVEVGGLEGMRGDFEHQTRIAQDNIAVAEEQHRLAEIDALQRSRQVEDFQLRRGIDVDNNSATLEPVAEVESIPPQPQQVGESYVIKKGGSFLRGAQTLDNYLAEEHKQAILQKHPEWAKLSDSKMLNQWRVDEAKKNGFWWDDKARYSNKVLHTGAEMKLVVGTDGYPHIELGDDHVKDLKGTLVTEHAHQDSPSDHQQQYARPEGPPQPYRELIDKSGIMGDMVDAGKVSDADMVNMEKAAEFYADQHLDVDEFRARMHHTLGLDDTYKGVQGGGDTNALLRNTIRTVDNAIATQDVQHTVDTHLGVDVARDVSHVSSSRATQRFIPDREVGIESRADISGTTTAESSPTEKNSDTHTSPVQNSDVPARSVHSVEGAKSDQVVDGGAKKSLNTEKMYDSKDLEVAVGRINKIFSPMLDRLERSPTFILDEKQVSMGIGKMIHDNLKMAPETLSDEVTKILSKQYNDPINQIRDLALQMHKDGSLENLSPQQKLFIGGDDVFNTSSEFVKVKVLSVDGNNYVADAYLPIGEKGSPASHNIGIKFDDARGYRFMSREDLVFTAVIDEHGNQIVQIVDPTTNAVKPMTLASR